MKKVFVLFLFLSIIFSSCSKKQKTFGLFNPKVNVSKVGNGYKLNASVNVRGFVQEENAGKYFANLSYSINLYPSKGYILNNVDSGQIKKEKDSILTNILINATADLDSTFKAGKYKLLFIVNDNLSQKQIELKTYFVLNK